MEDVSNFLPRMDHIDGMYCAVPLVALLWPWKRVAGCISHVDSANAI